MIAGRPVPIVVNHDQTRRMTQASWALRSESAVSNNRKLEQEVAKEYLIVLR